MEILVGVNGGPQSDDALALGLAIAESVGASLVVAHVFPVAYDYPSQAHVDAEWRAYLAEEAEKVLAEARTTLNDIPGVTYTTHGDRSSGIGLADLASQRGAAMIIIGSAPGGAQDRIHGGSTSDQLFHGSPVPVAIAPHGYRNWAPKRIERAVIAYRDNRESDHCVAYTVRGLQKANVDIASRIHLVTLMAGLPRRFRSSDDGRKSEVLATLLAQAEASLAKGRGVVTELTGSREVATSVLEAEDVTRALSRFDWHDEDVLVVGSRGVGPIKRVFLGDMTYKIIGAATVPVVVVPRSATSEA